MLLDQASYYPVITNMFLSNMSLSLSPSLHLPLCVPLSLKFFPFIFLHFIKLLASDEDMLSNGGDFIIDRTGLVKYWRRTIGYERPPVSLLLDTFKANAAPKQ